jgi:hypothetical protein
MMPSGMAKDPSSYDLEGPRSQLEPFLRSRRRLFLSGFVFSVALSGFIILVSIRPIEAHALPVQLEFGLVFFVSVLLFGAALLLPTQVGLKSGAVRLNLDDLGFTLVYPDRAHARVDWGDNNLSFDLIDMRNVAPTVLRVGTPYSIRVRGVRSLLTAEAYQAISSEVHTRRLSERNTVGSAFLYASIRAPIEIHVSQRTPGR